MELFSEAEYPKGTNRIIRYDFKTRVLRIRFAVEFVLQFIYRMAIELYVCCFVFILIASISNSMKLHSA